MTRTLCDIGCRFLLENAGVRGQLVQLDDAWIEVLRRVDYPAPVRTLLGEACAASALLAATLKFDGRLTLQLKGSGPVHLLLAQTTSAHGLRGLARWHDVVPSRGTVSDLFAEGTLTLSIDTGSGLPYSGTVPATGPRLQDALGAYFASSEQIPTQLWLHATEHVAAGLLLQRLPDTSPDPDDWIRLCLLAATVRPDELLRLEARELLHRLFPEDDVRLFEPQTMRFECSCSLDRSARILRQLGDAELRQILLTEDHAAVTCEFCGTRYVFDAVDCARLLDATPFEQVSPTQH